jgi:uncharacterized protein (DUF169 family)
MREKVARGETHQGLGLFATADAAARCLSANIKIPAGAPGTAGKILVGNLDKFPVQADEVILKLNPEQAMWICHSRSYSDGKHLFLELSTEANFCSGLAVYAYLRNDIQIGLGCFGSRNATNLKPEEMLAGIPIGLLANTTEVLEKLKAPMTSLKAKKIYHETYPDKATVSTQ